MQFRCSAPYRGCPEIRESASLAVHSQRVARCGLHAETVQNGSKDVIVIETVDQRFIQHHLVGNSSVDHSLIQIGGSKPPYLAGEHHVVAVMNLGEVIKRSRLLGEREQIRPAVVLNPDITLFYIDVGRSVFAHRAELDQVAFRHMLANRIDDIERADDMFTCVSTECRRSIIENGALRCSP